MRKLNGKSRMVLLVLVIVALFMALMINSDPVSAEKDQNSLKSTQDAAAITGTDSGYSPSVFPSMVKIISALALVIIAIYVGLYLLKKMMGKRYTSNRSGGVLEVLETTHLSPKQSISLIRVAGKAVLVGATETQIAVLSELDEASTEKIVKEMYNSEETEAFTSFLKTASSKLKVLTAGKAFKPSTGTQV